MNESYFGREIGFYLRKTLGNKVFCPQKRGINTTHYHFQKIDIALFGCHHTLPIPLIDIQGVYISQFFIGANRIHIGVNTIAIFYSVIAQRESFPFSQRMNYFGTHIAHVHDRKINCTFGTIQVIVYSCTTKYKKRCCNTAQS